jgi:hypothetical protein
MITTKEEQVLITKEIATKVLETVDAGLVKGLGQPVPGQMCVEAAVCFAMGLPHSDEPTCVSPAVRALKICLNDSEWSSDEERAKGMRRLALVQLGSAGVVDDNAFARRIAEMIVRKIVPMALIAAAACHLEQKHKDALKAAAVRCELGGTQEAGWAARSADAAGRAARWAAYSAARSADAAGEAAGRAARSADRAARWAARSADAAGEAAGRAARSAAGSADWAADAARWAAGSADWAADAARWAAGSAAYSADWAAGRAADAARWAACDKVLGAFAEEVVQVLIEMEAPGCQWLDLAPL